MKNKYRYSYTPKLLLTLIIFLSCLGECYAQKTDSLRKALNAPKLMDTMKVSILGKLAALYENTNTDSMFFFARQGLALAEKINFENGKGICQQTIALAYLHLNDYEKAIDNYKKALAVFKKTGYKIRIGSVLLSMGDIFYRQDKYNDAIEYYNRGIEVYGEINNNTGKGFALISIGGIYNDISNFAEALDYYLKALQAFEKDNYQQGISMSLTTIATVYSSLGDNKKALAYINKSLTVDESKNTREQQILNMHNIAAVYLAMKDYGKALQYYYKAQLIADSTGDDVWKDVTRLDIADAYYADRKFDTALEKYRAVLQLAEKIGDSDVIIGANRGIGRIYLQKGETKEAIQQLLLTLKMAESKQQQQTIFETAHDISSAYEKEKNYPLALQYLKIYYDTKDSVFNQKHDHRIQQLQFDYELSKKQSEIELLKKDSVIAESRNKQQKVTTIALLGGVALLIAISIILYRSRTMEKRRKSEILKQKEEIEQQSSKLEELNRFKDKTFSVLSHDLRSPLGLLTSTMQLLDNNAISGEEFTMIRHELNNQLNSVNILLDNLLNWAKSYFQGNLSAKPEPTNLYTITHQNIHLLHETAVAKKITLENNVASSIQAFCDPGQIDIVIRNLISNAIKFTRPGGAVKVSAASKQGKVQITVADNGVGMSQEQLHHIFTASSANSTYGTTGERGIGLGLWLCYEFVKANNGTISVTSEVNEGTTFTVILPESQNT